MFKIRTRIVVISTILYSTILISLTVYGFLDFWTSLKEIHKARIGRHMDKVVEELKNQTSASGFFDLSFIKTLPLADLDSIFYQLYDSNFTLRSKHFPVFDTPFYNNNIFSGDIYFLEYNRRHFAGYCSTVFLGGQKYFLAAAAVSPLSEEHYYKHKFWILFGVPVYIIVIIVTAYFLAGITLRPISRIITTVRMITATNLQSRLETGKAHDELYELSSTLNDMIERLEQAFESQRVFVANAAHEMKTPLTIIKTRLEILAERSDSAQQRDEIIQLTEETDRLAHLVQFMLILARLDSGLEMKQSDTIRLDEILLDSLEKYTPLAAMRNITFVLNMDDVFEIHGCAEELRIAIENIIDNAVKYSPANKNIIITIGGPENGLVSVAVKDSGPGIAFEDQPNIFSRFFRSNSTRSSHPGSGLGLAISHEIITRHSGRIDFVSSPGSGATFTIILPV